MRPRITPLAGSVVRTVTIRADSATRALAAALAARNLPVAVAAPLEGYVESAWYDVDARAARTPGVRGLGRIVKLRFFADPRGGQTLVVGECVHRNRWDPSLPERELERLVPPEHPGRALLDSVMVAALGPEPAPRASERRSDP